MDESAEPADSSPRWTCEACGCNTNAETDRNCTVCGTDNGSSLARRAGHIARAGLFARSVAARRSVMNEELAMDGYEFWERVDDDDVDMIAADDEHALAALAMEVADVGGRGDRGGPRSIVDAARSFAVGAGREPERLEPEELLRAAFDNGSLYQPKWMNPSHIGGRMRTGNGIEVGDGDSQNVAYLPRGAGEGRALRALEAFPRSAPFASFSLTSSSSGQERRPRRVFGFKVAFGQPGKDEGGNMGGSHLVGVTTTSFAAFSERNALQQSPFFWGIEDTGIKYEGSRHHRVSEHNRRAQSNYGLELTADEAPRNDDNVLFGCRQVITCVVDLESRTLTFWRDEDGERKLLGTIVTNLPRGGQLYPIVVPYNAGSTVAITGMAGDPLPLLSSFAAEWKKAQIEKDAQRRQELESHRSLLIVKGSLSPELIAVLLEIFSRYAANGGILDIATIQLTKIEASRLWYRCGMKLSSLNDILERKLQGGEKMLVFQDFCSLLQRIVDDDEERLSKMALNSVDGSDFEVGEKVELIEGYERFGDAASGPLLPGDRGTIIEMQNGPSGERNSIRVIHNSRRWWYQPQALIREGSGLTDSPSIWFLKAILRCHAYDEKTLMLLVGNQVTSSSWQIGDFVVPKKTSQECPSQELLSSNRNEAVGRIVFESPTSGSLSARGRVSGSVLVEFVSKKFADGASVQTGSSFMEKPFSLESRRVPTSRLIHTSACHGMKLKASSAQHEDLQLDVYTETKSMDVEGETKSLTCMAVDENVRADLKRMTYLDPSAVERIIKECSKTSTSLTGLFEAGLPKMSMEALDRASRNIQQSRSDENLAQAISALGKLALLVAEKAFPDECAATVSDNEDKGSELQSQDMRTEDSTVHTSRNLFQRARAGMSEADSDAALQESSRANRLSSLQQRRRMLLSMMSRARRTEGASFADILSRDVRGLSPLEMNADTAAAFLFASSGDVSNFGEFDEDQDSHFPAMRLENSRPSDSAPYLAGSNSECRLSEETLLDTVLRGRTPGMLPSVEEICPVPFLSIRNIVNLGILSNSLPWLKALLDSVMKKLPAKQASKRESPILKSATDEDRTPLLHVAMFLGCSGVIIKELIAFGAPVGESEIQIAAENDLPEALSILLNYKVYSEGMVDLQNCSSDVAAVVRDAVSRQAMQLLSLRKEADVFLVSFFQKMLEIGLLHRRRQQHRETELCGRAIAGTIIGNVELCALHEIQTDGVPETGENAGSRDLAIHARGLMQTLPIRILGRSLGEGPPSLTTLLLLIEEFLCSKGINDGGCGLTLLVTLLQRFPSFLQSPEIERYGFAELVASHDALALNRLSDISSRVAKKNSCNDGRPPIILDSCLVLCPKKHAASLHITKHSSFRCDLCGKGVERGAIMHGCRECDWDACEFCTDKAEGGIVKWKYVRELASKCQELLSQATLTSKENDLPKDIDWLALGTQISESTDDAMDANTLSIRLLQRDPDSLRILASMLSNRGQLTMHQFLCVILPALHSALMGKSDGRRLELRRSGAGRRSKKPRVAGLAAHTGDERMRIIEEEKLYFAKETIKSFVDDPSLGKDQIESKDLRHGTRSMNANADDDEYEGSDDGYDEQDANPDSKDEKMKDKQLPELFRRLHQVLSLHENVATIGVLNDGRMDAVPTSELQSLTKPIRILLIPATSVQQRQDVLKNGALTLQVEPLVSVEDISRQLLKSAATTNRQYVAFCRNLAEDSSVIVEKAYVAKSQGQNPWRIAKIVSFDEDGGWHTIRYACNLAGGLADLNRVLLKGDEDIGRIEYETRHTKLLLVARTFVVIHREAHQNYLKSPFNMEQLFTEGIVAENDEKLTGDSVVGHRIESDFQSSEWLPYTIVSLDCCNDEKKYALVSEDGEVVPGVPSNRIRGLGCFDETSLFDPSCVGSRSDRIGATGRNGTLRAPLSRAFPFLTTRQHGSRGEILGGSAGKTTNKLVLKRTWSALGPIESMNPVGVKATSDDRIIPNPNFSTWICDVGGKMAEIDILHSLVERPPSLVVQYSSTHVNSSVRLSAPADTTVLSLLHSLCDGEEFEVFGSKPHEIIYSLDCFASKDAKYMDKICQGEIRPNPCDRQPVAYPMKTAFARRDDAFNVDEWPTENRSRKSVYPSTDSDDGYTDTRLTFQGLDEICVQCLEIIELIAEVKSKMSGSTKDDGKYRSIFVNEMLSEKLSKQLENPLCVVGGAVPEWCFAIPSFAPNIFSYTSRKLLLDRVAFGVSRSTLRQQEAKVNVGRLRQRMTSLRARAVELVGEAFSGGAEDPTALQLQADELYGMEEALGARVRASFRAEGWEEMSLQVAKAVIHRDLLISDAMSIMDQYSTHPSLNKRRLEVRFNGESGFDAASGDEAGVTRGFYADVAEALLSCDVVAGVSVSSTCVTVLEPASSCFTSTSYRADHRPCKLPLWIPEVDASGQVIIPTPRAAPTSVLGIYPRPLSNSHPLYHDVLNCFRFMGRLFAAATRDGFMFPLPLSTAFLKLVQCGVHGSTDRVNVIGFERWCSVLDSEDLPRPGFLGGEVYAVEIHICQELDQIDQSDPPFTKSERERQYCRIASDKGFAQIALGKKYECSFDDYFQDKTFVDPLDPTQGIEAHALCPNGHNINVTIQNIREWVALAKAFMLHDGVIDQAAAFRAGVDDFFASDFLRLFTPEELQSDVCGVGDNVDSWDEESILEILKLDGKGVTEALVAVAAIGGNAEALSRRFGPTSGHIKYLIKSLLEASPKQRRQFLSFVTSVPIVTPGPIEVVPMVSSSGEFLPMRDPGCLPRANTCARRLYLPKFETYESFSQVLWAVIGEESKHKGFFEWSL